MAEASRNTTDRPAGEIRGDALYKATVLAARLSWGAKGYRQAKRAGLRTVKFGRQEFVLGADAIEFFRKLADEAGKDAQ